MRCLRHALQGLGAACPADDVLATHIGWSLRATFAALLPAPEPARIERAVALYRERFDTVGLFENRVYPAIPSVLEGLGRTARLYVATQKSGHHAGRIVDHFGLRRHFARVYGTDDDGPLDDKVAVVGALLRAEGLAAGEAVMIGDRDLDVAAAGRHGLRAVGVLWGYGSRAELVAAGATALCDDPAALPAVLARLPPAR